MEQELKSNLRSLADAYMAATGRGHSALGRLIANDGSFFDRVFDKDKSFTVRTYDAAVEWFSANWPEGVKWPRGVRRPEPANP